MKRVKPLITLPIVIIGGATLFSTCQKKEQQIPQQQINYVFDPSHLTKGILVKVDYTGEHRKSVFEIGEQKLTTFFTGIEHANDYSLARNRIIPNGSEGVLVGATQHSYFVLFPGIDQRYMPAKFSDSWFVSSDSPGRCGSYDLVQISEYQEGKDGLVARFGPDELLVEGK